MCVPCVAAAPAFLETALIAAGFLIAAVVVVLWKGLQALPRVATALWRWFSGARIVEQWDVPEERRPLRRYARHVHATLRTVGTVSVPLAWAYPMFFYALSALLTGTVVGVAVNRARIWRDNRLSARKTQDVLAGTPIRVKAEIGARFAP